MSVLKSGVFTYQLSDETLVITESMGVRMISIFNASAVNGTYLGDQSLSGFAPTPIEIEEDETATVVAIEASVIKGLTIEAPLECTLKVIAIV